MVTKAVAKLVSLSSSERSWIQNLHRGWKRRRSTDYGIKSAVFLRHFADDPERSYGLEHEMEASSSRGKRQFEIEQDDPKRSYGLEHEMEASSSRGKQRRISRHEIFLSHSGQDKPFVEQLYQDLKKANHDPFFDQDSDSLPKAEKFAPKILEAAEQCRLGVVVVSEGYLTSKWPMLELNKFLESKKTRNRDLKLFPLFYKLLPSDLMDSNVETKWKLQWRELVEKGEVKEESIESWSQAVKELRASNELEFAKFANSEYKYRCVVVDEMNKLLPPILEWDIGHIQGYECLCKNKGVVTQDNIVQYSTI